MMKRLAFQEAVDRFRHQDPFQPFIVEMDDGTRFVVNQPKMLMCYAGAATYFGSDGEWQFVDSEDVHQVMELTPVTQS